MRYFTMDEMNDIGTFTFTAWMAMPLWSDSVVDDLIAAKLRAVRVMLRVGQGIVAANV